MKKLFIATLFLSSLAFAKPLTGEVHVKVKGMVCAFCAQGLTKTFKKMPEVEKVNVSLEEKFVHLVLKKDASLEDTKIIEAIKEAGYEGTISN
ncbi:heavy-metal-associated domain-containing protein [Pseudobdellovibrio sp. HCB154]|uniref:heavy-metal-associated domain-containing protein n=1 Tax=Pseudobdellovibrio sp. HCB154 TaxID=3386277 RepID=UPI0039172D4B